jgi:hypothetical protein
MKRINVMVSDAAKDVLIDYKDRQGYNTLDEANEAFLIEFKGVRTYKGNWIKKHVGCGGLIRYTENMDPSTPQVFDMECLKCGKMVCEEEIEFERR